MRTIKFRGKRIDNGEWVYGAYAKVEDRAYILQGRLDDDGVIWSYIHVHPDSIGEFTGLHDKNGKEIYEGDKVGGDNNTLLQGIVIWSDNDVGWRMKITEGYYEDKIIGFVDDQLEIIGTIHDEESQ